MECKKCNSNNVQVQIINETILKRSHHSIIYWLFIGWWLEVTLWLFLTIPRLLWAIFGHKKMKTVNKQKKIVVCQDCGYSFKI